MIKEEDKRRVTLSVRITNEQNKALGVLSMLYGKTISATIRKIIDIHTLGKGSDLFSCMVRARVSNTTSWFLLGLNYYGGTPTINEVKEAMTIMVYNGLISRVTAWRMVGKYPSLASEIQILQEQIYNEQP